MVAICSETTCTNSLAFEVIVEDASAAATSIGASRTPRSTLLTLNRSRVEEHVHCDTSRA